MCSHLKRSELPSGESRLLKVRNPEDPEWKAFDGPQDQSSQNTLGVGVLLVSLDSFRSFAFGTPHWGDTPFAPRQWRKSHQIFPQPKRSGLSSGEPRLLRLRTIGSSPCMGTAYEKHMLSDIIKYALNSVNNIDQFIV